jgi:hypothetical protein
MRWSVTPSGLGKGGTRGPLLAMVMDAGAAR